MSELKSCPFCKNSTDFLIERVDLSSSVVICQGMVSEYSACLARGPIGIQDDDGEEQPGKAAAIRYWNASALPEGYVLVPVEFAKFLLGERKFNGYEFGDMHQVRVGRFWWRSDLRAMLAAAQEVEVE